jgi:6-phosphogluconolactonase
MKRRHLLSLSATVLMPAAATPPSPRFLHVGSYAPLGQGIYSFAIAADGGLKPLGVTANAHSPSWLAAHEGRVYAAEEGGDHVAVYAQDDNGQLQLLQRQASGGSGPAHLSLASGLPTTATPAWQPCPCRPTPASGQRRAGPAAVTPTAAPARKRPPRPRPAARPVAGMKRRTPT